MPTPAAASPWPDWVSTGRRSRTPTRPPSWPPRSPDIQYKAARVYAQALARLDEDAAKGTAPPAGLRLRYQDRTLQLIDAALAIFSTEEQKAAFWHKQIEGDTALGLVQETLTFLAWKKQFLKPVK